MPDIHLGALFGSVIANVIIGSLWFGPVFGDRWMELVGISKEEIGKSWILPMIFSVIGAVFTAMIFGILTAKMGVDSMRGYVESAFWLWLGFTAITSFTNASYAGRSKALWALETFYWLLAFVVMACIYAFFLT